MKRNHIRLVNVDERDPAANDPTNKKEPTWVSRVGGALAMLVVTSLFFLVYLPHRVAPGQQLFYGWLFMIGFIVFLISHEAKKNEAVRTWFNRVRGVEEDEK